MKITAFNGSPKANRGNTQVIVDAFLKGARDAGAETETVFLSKQTIHHCASCLSCWTKTPGRCVHDDDMAVLLEKLLSSDTVIFATPVYVDNVSGMMKQFLDRIIPIADPRWEKDSAGECRHRRKHDKPVKIIAVANCGFPEQSHFSVLRILFRRMARNMSCELAGEIYRGGGALLTIPEPGIKPFVENYKARVKEAGLRFVREGYIPEDLMAELEEPLLPVPNFADMYMARVNEIFG